MKASTVLVLIKLVHTVAWAFFAACIIALPIAAFFNRFDVAAILTGLVVLEILILAFNRWACPLTGLAARYTADRSDNFDIFLPLLLARYNKQVFGALFVLALAYTGVRWFGHAGGA